MPELFFHTWYWFEIFRKDAKLNTIKSGKITGFWPGSIFHTVWKNWEGCPPVEILVSLLVIFCFPLKNALYMLKSFHRWKYQGVMKTLTVCVCTILLAHALSRKQQTNKESLYYSTSSNSWNYNNNVTYHVHSKELQQMTISRWNVALFLLLFQSIRKNFFTILL